MTMSEQHGLRTLDSGSRPVERSRDGRRARRHRGRDQVIDAWLELVFEGDVCPSAVAVAERAEVSLRSVFRYFDDVDELWERGTLRFVEEHCELFKPLRPADTCAERVQAVVEARLRLFAQCAPLTRALLARAPIRPEVDALVDEWRNRLTAGVLDYLQADLDALDSSSSAAAQYGMLSLLSFGNLHLLHNKYGLSIDEVHQVLHQSMTALLQGVLAPASA